jgi:glucose-6-phosphate isomerase
MFSIINASQKTPSDLLEKCLMGLDKVLSEKTLGFTKLPERKYLWDECQKLADSWKGKVDQIVLLGTGGSSMGTQVIMETMGISNVIFIDNVDPEYFHAQMKKIISISRTAFLVVSKSGTTIETLCSLEMIIQSYKLSEYVAIISEKRNTALASWALKNYYPHLEIPLDVGGRYSVLSPVGMFPAALVGLDLEKFRKGATDALGKKELVAQLMAQSLMSFERNEWITAFWIYSSRGNYMGRWIQQLWAESLGKEKNKLNEEAPRVSTPIVGLGTVDQHSTLQQMIDGARDKFYWFIRFGTLEVSSPLEKTHFPETEFLRGRSMGELLGAEAIATQKALEHKGRSALCLKTDSSLGKGSGEEVLGFFLMMMELVVAGIAQQLSINAFDQPGVELGKRLARSHFTSGS